MRTAGIFTRLAMSLLVMTVNSFVFGILPNLKELPTYVGTIILISAIIMAVIGLFSRRLGTNDLEPARYGVPILDRLPLNELGPVVAFSVKEHYVRVRTVKGEEMVLMRLADAIGEVESVQSAHVHRSHRAAFEYVERVTRQSERGTLHMPVGPDIPVSRANLSKLKEAGLLP